jgi:hypothetical protein
MRGAAHIPRESFGILGIVKPEIRAVAFEGTTVLMISPGKLWEYGMPFLLNEPRRAAGRKRHCRMIAIYGHNARLFAGRGVAWETATMRDRRYLDGGGIYILKIEYELA